MALSLGGNEGQENTHCAGGRFPRKRAHPKNGKCGNSEKRKKTEKKRKEGTEKTDETENSENSEKKGPNPPNLLVFPVFGCWRGIAKGLGGDEKKFCGNNAETMRRGLPESSFATVLECFAAGPSQSESGMV